MQLGETRRVRGMNGRHVAGHACPESRIDNLYIYFLDAAGHYP